MNEEFKQIMDLLPVLIPIILLQFGLQIAAIINLIKRKKVRFDNKFLWGVIILAGGMIGSIVYFIARGDDY